MKIVVDTNIVFSAILNANSRIAKLLLGSKRHFQFYSCNFLRVEISRHREKLLKLTHFSKHQLAEVENLTTGNIIFIDERLLPKNLLVETEKLLATIDPSDTPFVALARHLKATLWTGDMQLYKGLKSRRQKNVVNTEELFKLLENLNSA